MSATPLLEIKDLVVEYRGGGFGAPKIFRALKGVNMSVQPGETLGIVGESGCGKSTLAKAITRLLPITSGSITYQGTEIAHLRGTELMAYRRGVQMVFQDPADSLNPKHTIGSIIAEPLEIHKRPNRKARVDDLLQLVGLPSDFLKRYPHELSGGQRQRVGIARALALEPKLIICDEPVSALDLSIQSQIVNLLLELQRRLGLSYIFISHDLRLVRHLSDRIVVMQNGEVVEYGPAQDVYHNAQHPYTQKLLTTLPSL